MKKLLIMLLVVVVLGGGWWLIAPLWSNTVLDEALPGQDVQVTIIDDALDGMDVATKEQFEEQTAAMSDKTIMMKDEMPSGGPVVIASGSLIARAHEVEGTASIIEVGDTQYVRFENLKTINGPDLRIYLSSDLGVSDAVDLGPIRATEGNVNYEMPAGTDVTKYHNVLIWCRAFSVLFSYAQL